MPYLSSHRGDYARGYRGDPGFFKSLLKGIGKVAGVFLGGGAAPPAQIIQMQAPPRYAPAQMFPGGTGLRPGFGVKQVAAPIRGRVRTALMAKGQIPDTPEYRAYLAGGRKRKRMNVANPKALRRAIRRQAGFVKLAKRSLKGSGYTIVSKGSRRPARAVHITESGPGSVNVR